MKFEDIKTYSELNIKEVFYGDIFANNYGLISLEGIPEQIYGSVDAKNNNLTDLKYAPYKVKDTFDISYNKLKSLKGCPECKILIVNNNELKTLEGCPKVLEYLNISSNELISLKGELKEIERTFICSNNKKLKSLKYMPKVGKDLVITMCSNLSLEEIYSISDRIKGIIYTDYGEIKDEDKKLYKKLGREKFFKLKNIKDKIKDDK